MIYPLCRNWYHHSKYFWSLWVTFHLLFYDHNIYMCIYIYIYHIISRHNWVVKNSPGAQHGLRSCCSVAPTATASGSTWPPRRSARPSAALSGGLGRGRAAKEAAAWGWIPWPWRPGGGKPPWATATVNDGLMDGLREKEYDSYMMGMWDILRWQYIIGGV